MSWPEIIAVAKDIVLAVAAIVTASAAWLGLTKWRDELRGRVNFDVARGLARATYRLRDELRSARSPLIRGAEFPPGYKGQPGSTGQAEAQAWAYVYKNRWEPVAQALREFEAQSLEAEALWGAEIRELCQTLGKCALELFISMETMIEDKVAGGQNFASDREFGVRVRADVSASASAKDNPLSNRIAAAVGGIEARLRGHLSRT